MVRTFLDNQNFNLGRSVSHLRSLASVVSGAGLDGSYSTQLKSLDQLTHNGFSYAYIHSLKDGSRLTLTLENTTPSIINNYNHTQRLVVCAKRSSKGKVSSRLNFSTYLDPWNTPLPVEETLFSLVPPEASPEALPGVSFVETIVDLSGKEKEAQRLLGEALFDMPISHEERVTLIDELAPVNPELVWNLCRNEDFSVVKNNKWGMYHILSSYYTHLCYDRQDRPDTEFLIEEKNLQGNSDLQDAFYSLVGE